jgi:DNA invertase Pin-like site-specific DNA recombinase
MTAALNRKATMRAIAYTRVSDTRNRDDNLQSPDVQLEKIGAEIEARGWHLAEHFHEQDVSGADLSRRELNRAIGLVESGEADAIVVYMLSRFARTTAAGDLIDRIEAAGGQVVSVSEPGIDGSVGGRFMRDITLAVDAHARRISKEHRRNARERAVREGLQLGGVPIGYRRRYPDGSVLTYEEERAIRDLPKEERARLPKRPKQAGPLVKDPETAPVVLGIFERSAAGVSLVRLKDYAYEQGVEVSTASIRGLLRNRTYLGEVRHGEFVNPTAHEPIVDEVLFRRAQRGGVKFRGDGYERLLSGLARCAGCRSTLKANHQNDRAPYYTCRHASLQRERCAGSASITAAALERYVEREFVEWLGEARLRARDDSGADRLREVDAALATVDDEIAEWCRPAVRSRLGTERWSAGLDELENQRADVVAQRDALLAELGLPEGLLQLEAAEDYFKLPPVDRRRLLGLAVDVVFVRQTGARGPASRRAVAERTHVVWRPHGRSIDLPRPGKRFAWRPFVFPDEAEAPARVALGQHL